jgi:HSP20 family molecular chaperone IbpA
MSELMEAPVAQGAPVDAKSGTSEVFPHHNAPEETAFSQPRYHYQEQSDTIKLVVHVPGADPAGIDLEVDIPDLTITASRNHSQKIAHQSSPLSAAMHDYQLRLRLGFSLAYDALRAELHGSTLTVTIPKKTTVSAVV